MNNNPLYSHPIPIKYSIDGVDQSQLALMKTSGPDMQLERLDRAELKGEEGHVYVDRNVELEHDMCHIDDKHLCNLTG